MNQKELNEIRRRFKLDKNSISKIFGCYVNSNKEIISWIDASMGLMQQEEQEMYLGLLKKALSGALGKNLVDITFSTAQVADSDEHRLLQTMRQTELKDPASRENFCRRLIDALNMGETNYLILLAADTYDVPHKSRDDEFQADAGDTVYRYFVCAVCPVKAPTLELRYDHDLNEFHPGSTGHIALAPELGFLYPAFDSRAANIYDLLFYAKNPAELHQEVIDALFRVEPPMSAAEQKNVFDTALTEALDEACSYDVVQSVHEQIRAKIEDHKESHDPEPLELSGRDVKRLLELSGVPEEKMEHFDREYAETAGEKTSLLADNLTDSRKFSIKTPDITIQVSPECAGLIETRVIDGRKCLVIAVDDRVEVNGMPVQGI